MAKIENLLLILHLLISRRSVQLETIVKECGISERTAFRYLRSLEAAGFPLFFDKDCNGYRLISRNGALAALSPAELSAVFLGVDLLETILSPAQLEVFRRVKLKLESFMTPEVQKELGRLIRSVANSSDSRQLREHLIISLLKSAQMQNLKVRLHCRDGKAGISVTELNHPTLRFEREWKIRTEDNRTQPTIRLADVVDIEFL